MNRCEKCKHSKLDDKDKARIRILCSYKNKFYYYGQHIECANFEKKETK